MFRKEAYYRMVSETFILVSPRGDRPDCYRHWEAIGLGAMPACNCPRSFVSLFEENMVYVENDDLVKLLNISSTFMMNMYRPPARHMIFVSAWAKKINIIRSSAGYPRLDFASTGCGHNCSDTLL